ncbi:type I-F CRISPR-associated protein Csy3 [Pasteurella atlantica]|uniref:Type I-F CRISPR-associated protein Csy3 n=2 Tax=Pasteurellaceae TaxID=712 RepID=A0ACC6HL90_9PAST|nr:type I-F CRISPR-associated protein Csy3 [Pasteurella atlantica]MDP8051661.1 type I-F CRISPR-associated protein Csy3 [Pasteurella atlantica]MDP8105016.1 type I-F CRISPR-associated protein Csy3 [Pasteurella atlantica]MDP8148319.1 type I-F CRISPR-associated protein Csy3 [Pasteurella atlantica]
MSKLTTASVLAFERNLDISDAFFSQLDSQRFDEDSRNIKVTEKTVRATIGNRFKKDKELEDNLKLDANPEKANIQTIDVATLDDDMDTLCVKWSCKVLPFTGTPCVCNDQTYQKRLQHIVDEYLNEYGIGELAKRYAINIANARWLWRNRMGAECIEVKVTCGKKKLSFDAKKIKLQNFDIENTEIEKLATLIEQGLTGEEFIILYIEAKAKVGYGQEVYPSQEFVRVEDKSKKQGRKSKVLYQFNDKAGLHSQKIGNAIRTIDDWYPNARFPIAIEPYGAVTTLGEAFRKNKEDSFYGYFDDWVLRDKKPPVEQQHYVIGVLIRGGVFGASGKE